jgi:hypothetical protein
MAPSAGLLTGFPDIGFSATIHSSGQEQVVVAPHRRVRPRRYPVQRYRLQLSACTEQGTKKAIARMCSAGEFLGKIRAGNQLCACLRDMRSHVGCGAFGLGGIGGIIGRRNAIKNTQANIFANAAAPTTIPENPKSPDKMAAESSSKDQRSIAFRMASLNADAWHRDS